MTRMKHYHLGCGESLQSHWSELQVFMKTTGIERGKPKFNNTRKSKSGKRH